jgi:protein arginine kinase
MKERRYSMENWQRHEGKNEELVLTTRIRIARNINDKPFPHKLNIEEAKKVIDEVNQAFYTSSHMRSEYKTIYLDHCDENICTNFFEKHLISPKLISNRTKAAFITGEDETVSIMINEEDHIRLQCVTGGLNLKEGYDMANKLDNLIEENISYAFDEKMGYITACPTNMGTGLRASVMVHLPGLTMNNEMEGILKALTQVGMTIRGLYGEGSKAMGNMYQISNQITLGVTEEDILNNLQAVINQIVNQEYMTREQFMKIYKYELEDKIYRSLGILETAVLLNTTECMDLLSNVRMGVEMGIIKNINKNSLNKLLVDTQPAAMQMRFNTKLNDKERDLNRARLVREILKQKPIEL